jgi:cytoskeleton protein RodZ
MTDVGGKLRVARERRGISLRQISEATKISVMALEALERNDPSRLPGGIFTRAIVRAYATQVGLDPETTVREFLTRFALETEPYTLAAAVKAARTPPARHFGILVKVLVASVVVALILYLAFSKTHESRSSTLPPGDHARRTGQRAARLV